MTDTPRERVQRIDVEAIRARERAATNGPWEVAPHSDASDVCEIVADYSELPGGGKQAHWIAELDAQCDMTDDPQADIDIMNANAEFIAHARRDIPDLLAELDRLTARLAERETRFRDLLADYDVAADKFIAKVESGRAFSRETYADLKACRLASKQELAALASPHTPEPPSSPERKAE